MDYITFTEIVLATTSNGEESGDGSFVLLLLGPAAGLAFYFVTYARYRNKNKTHEFENETTIVSRNLQKLDQKVSERKGTTDSKTSGANHKLHRKRVGHLKVD